MRITYIKLMNFANIFAAMRRRMVEVDFSKCKNRVVLFIGDNGSGKTSIMSELHPFAQPGSMDVRNGSEMIMDDEDGHKEIRYAKNEDKYVIKHHYLYKSGKGLKSFISKNGVELNPNGNVSSFKELVKMELGIELENMALMRLGSNVTGVIDKKAAERKSFISDLLKDIDIYSQFYKKINDDSRAMKTMMKSVSEKIGKLRIFDEKEEVSKLEDLGQQLIGFKRVFDNIRNDIGMVDGAIQILIPEGIDSFVAEISTKDSDYRRIVRDITSREDKLSKSFVIITGDIDESIDEINEEIRANENTVIVNKGMMDFYFNQLNSLNTQKIDKENDLRYITSELEYSKLGDLCIELSRDYDEMKSRFKNFSPKCTRDEMLRALGLLQEIDKIISTINECDTTAILNVVEHFIQGQNVDSIVKFEVGKIDDKISKTTYQINRLDESSGYNPNAMYVLFKPPGSNCSCPFEQFYNDVTQGKTGSDKQKLMGELKVLEKQRDLFLAYLDVARKIEYIFMIIKTNKALIEKIPESFFAIPTILKSIRESMPFYDEDYFTNYIATLEEFDTFQGLDDKIKEVKKEMRFIEKNNTSLSSMQKELENLDLSIHNTNKDLNRMRKENEKLEKLNSNLQFNLDELLSYKESLIEIVDMRKEATETRGILEKMNETKVKVQELMANRKIKQVSATEMQIKVEKTEEEISDIKFKLKEFASLTEEKRILEEQFDEVDLIRESLSSNKGMPLLFIQLYLKDAKIHINDLLDYVYKGELEIGDFVINDKEFRIPYTKNGMTVSDAIRCSQGERSFISLALSFALIKKSIPDYNIMLLDEIDSTLDQENRYKFIAILEEQLESIGAEQVFLITHNNMFDNYPVDVVMTSDMKIDNYKNTNVIFKVA